jgi:hypothetical protein
LIQQQSIVKLEPTSPPPKRKTGRKDKFTNADLPKGTLDGGGWRRTFIPSYLQYLSSREIEDAWAIDDNEAASIMQNVWDFIYGARVRCEIAVAGPVFFIVRNLLLVLPLCLRFTMMLFRLISVPASGVVDLVPPRSLFSKHSSLTIKLTRMPPVRKLWSLPLTIGLSFIVKSRSLKIMKM